MDKQIYDVIIIGGGVIGVSIAYKLSQNGVKCAIIEKNQLGSGATNAAAGVISPLFYGSDKSNSPMRKIRELSYEMFLHLDNEFEELEIESPFNKTGIFRTAFNQSELQLLIDLASKTSKLGVKSELISDRSQQKELGFLNSDILGGMYFPDEGYVDGIDFVNKFRIAILKMNSDIFENEEFVDFEIIDDEIKQIKTKQNIFHGNTLIFATGSENILSKYNISNDFIISPVRGQYILVRTQDFDLPYTIGDGTYGQIDDGPQTQGYLVPRDNGVIYIGASKHINKNDLNLDLNGIEFCLAVAKKYLNNINNLEFISAGAGIRPQSKIGVPIIKKIFDNDNILFVSGHYTQGMMLSLGTAEIVKNYLLNFDQELFDLFDGINK